MVGLNAAPEGVKVVQTRIAYHAVFKADATESAVHGGSAEVGDAAAAHAKIEVLAVGDAVAANAERTVADPCVLDAGGCAPLNEDSAQKSAPLARNVAIKRLEAVAFEHHGIVKGAGVGRVNEQGSARSYPEPRAAVEVNAGPGRDAQGGPAVDYRIPIDDVGFVVTPDFVGSEHHIGYEQVWVGFGLVNRQHAVGVVKVGVPGQRNEVNALAETALLDAQGVLPEHFAVAAGRRGFYKHPNTVAGRNYHVFKVGSRSAVGVEAERGFAATAKANAA